jgi:hypothetical protein
MVAENPTTWWSPIGMMLVAVCLVLPSCWPINPCLRCECLSDNVFQPCPDPYNDYDPTWTDVTFCEDDGWEEEDFRELESYMVGYAPMIEGYGK